MRSIVRRLCASGSTPFISLASQPPARSALTKDVGISEAQGSARVSKPARAGAGATFRDERVYNLEKEVAKMSPDDVRQAVVRRLQYQSRYRGMVEMDLILGSFAKAALDSYTLSKLEEYDKILRQFDNDLFKWIIMNEPVPEEIAKLSVWGELLDFAEQQKTQLLANMH